MVLFETACNLSFLISVWRLLCGLESFLISDGCSFKFKFTKMKVLIVCNNVHMRGNGVSTAVRSLMQRLADEGIDVRLAACKNPDKNGMQPDYPFDHFRFPIFEPIISSNGFMFAKTDRDMLTKAVSWADVIHIMEAFPLESAAVEIAGRLGKPCVGTYHTFTENITANLGLSGSSFINRLISWWWKKSVYDHCECIQCPTEKVKRHLEENGYISRLEVISNGIVIPEETDTPKDPPCNPYIILCIGRLAKEKSQGTLMEAMRYSRHSKEIELQFAGKGPKMKEYINQAQSLMDDNVLDYEPVFGFYNQDELKNLTRHAYLYIHCADVEVEGLSCLEAIKEGVVPVIAESRMSSTSQFALDERSLFPAHDPEVLAARIDWWIEHPAERMEMGRKYMHSVRDYDIRKSTEQIINMYKDALIS